MTFAIAPQNGEHTSPQSQLGPASDSHEHPCRLVTGIRPPTCSSGAHLLLRYKSRAMPLSLLSSAFPSHHPTFQTIYPPAAVSSNMRTFSLFTIGTAALAMFSSLPSACGAAVVKRDAASEARAFLQDATSQVASVKSSEPPCIP